MSDLWFTAAQIVQFVYLNTLSFHFVKELDHIMSDLEDLRTEHVKGIRKIYHRYLSLLRLKPKKFLSPFLRKRIMKVAISFRWEGVNH